MIDRRALLASLAAAGATAAFPRLAPAQGAPFVTRRIPSSGEQIPLVGLGSWRTFNVGNDPEARNSCAEVMRAFFAGGGRMIDSSPMYGSSQDTIGYGLKKLNAFDKVFAADKVWTRRKPKLRARGGGWPASICCRSTIFCHGRSTCRCSWT
jgi:hypothetical protein